MRNAGSRIRIALTAAAVLAAAAVEASAKPDKPGRSAAANKSTVGVVSSVQMNWVVIETPAQQSLRFNLNKQTVYARATGGKRGGAAPAEWADVQTGTRVKIVSRGKQALKVTLCGSTGQGTSSLKSPTRTPEHLRKIKRKRKASHRR